MRWRNNKHKLFGVSLNPRRFANTRVLQAGVVLAFSERAMFKVKALNLKGKVTSLDPGTGFTVRAAWFPT